MFRRVVVDWSSVRLSSISAGVRIPGLIFLVKLKLSEVGVFEMPTQDFLALKTEMIFRKKPVLFFVKRQENG